MSVTAALVGLILIVGGAICLPLCVAALYYRRRIRETLADDPDLARAWKIKGQTRSSYRPKRGK